MGEQTKVWPTTLLLCLLAERGVAAGASFSSRALRDWAGPELRTGDRIRHGMKRLLTKGYVTTVMKTDASGLSFALHTLTESGHRAAQEAARGKPVLSGPVPGQRQTRPRPPTTFTARMWGLMRARRMLDAASAAETLVDAGGDVEAATRTAQRVLRRWEECGAIQRSARRPAGSFTRFVLVQDSIDPPRRAPA